MNDEQAFDDLELLGHIAMCVRLKLRRDQAGRTMPPEDERLKARIERGEKALRLLRRRMDRIRAEKPPISGG